MSDPALNLLTPIAVDSRGHSDPEPQDGVVVEDYADTVIDTSALTRDWAPPLR